MLNVLEDKRKAWDLIFSDPHLSLNSLRQRAIAGSVCQNGLRSVCWKIFLGYLPSLEFSTWSSLLLKERQRYIDLKRKYIDEPTEKMKTKGEQDLSSNNPLALSDTNPWQQFFADSEIKKVIRQDVERTFPDVDFFRENNVQERLTDILFIYCKLNRDVSYRQGMHELLAPFYWVLALEALPKLGIDSSDPVNKLMIQVLDSDFVEHDAYILFEKLMTYGKSWYEFNEDVSKPASNRNKNDLLFNNNIPKPTDSARLNPVVMICHRIHHQYLRTVDPILYRHLENFGIEPQLYGLRWIRLLFGREFDIYDLLKLWDAIFAQDPSLEIVEYICLVMLLRMRDQLLQKDYAECLSMLMRPPQITKPASLVEQAKYLQENLNQDTALHILQQNDVRAGKEPRNSMMDGVPQQRPPLQHKSSQGFDSFSRLTNNMMKNPQVRDLNRAIAGVMGTVQKNVNTFGENVLGKPQDQLSVKKSEFPSSIDRIVATHKSQIPPIPIPKNQQQQKMNLEMGKLMAECISILEKEIFENTNDRKTKQEDETQVVPEEELNTITHNEDDTKEEEMSLNNNDTANDETSLNGESKQSVEQQQDEAKIIMALVGLKHVRDVLLGKQLQFDASVIDMKTPSPTDAKEWDIVDPKEVPEPVSPPPSKHINSVFVPPISTNSPVLLSEEKPLPPITYVPTNPAPPKQHIKYRIEDLLSDPDLQLPSPKTTNKFKWMLEQQEELKDNNSDYDLFKTTESKSPIRKRSSFIVQKKPTVVDPTVVESTVDPLDARSIDSRKAYEYDVL